MKYFHTLMMGLAVMASLAFTSCGDDDEPEITYETKEISIKPEEVDAKPLGFYAYDTWTLTSNQMWCKLRQGGKTAMSLTGSEGDQVVELVIDAAAATDKEQKATLTLTTVNKTFIIANVTLGTISYRGVILHNGSELRSATDKDIPVFEMSGELGIQANFDFHLEMPEWCLVNSSRSFEGKAGETYPVVFTFDESAGVDKRYVQNGELVFAGSNVRDVFTIKYLGMDKYVADISLGDNEIISPWNWVIDIDNQLYMHSDAKGNVSKHEGGVPFTVLCRQDDVKFVYFESNAGNSRFSTNAEYGNVTGEAGYYTFSLKGDIPANGKLMAFSGAAWDTIKADPVACLMEMDEELGYNVLTYKAVNNVVIDWHRLMKSDSPFIVHHNTLYDENGMLYYELTKTSEYKNIFGTDNVWTMSMNPSAVNLCIVLEGYQNEWFSALRMGFDNKLNIPLDDIAENGSCSQGIDGEVPAFSIFMSAEHRAMLQRGPFYIAVVNPDTKAVTGLVIKANTTRK